MDIITDFGSVVLGSSPGGCTIQKAPSLVLGAFCMALHCLGQTRKPEQSEAGLQVERIVTLGTYSLRTCERVLVGAPEIVMPALLF